MAENNCNSLSTLENLRDALDIHEELSPPQFCTMIDYDAAIDTLFDELDAFEIGPTSLSKLIGDDGSGNDNLKKTAEPLESVLVKLMNSTWILIHKHRNLMQQHDNFKEQQSRILNENSKLSNQVARLKQAVQKKDNSVREVKERERQSKVLVSDLTRDLKREKEETAKLNKRIQSKDIQHAHELRRMDHSKNKLRARLQRTVEKYIPRDQETLCLESPHESRVRLYKQTINRLQDNHKTILQEIKDLKETLSLHGELEPQVESCGI